MFFYEKFISQRSCFNGLLCCCVHGAGHVCQHAAALSDAKRRKPWHFDHSIINGKLSARMAERTDRFDRQRICPVRDRTDVYARPGRIPARLLHRVFRVRDRLSVSEPRYVLLRRADHQCHPVYQLDIERMYRVGNSRMGIHHIQRHLYAADPDPWAHPGTAAHESTRSSHEEKGTFGLAEHRSFQ